MIGPTFNNNIIGSFMNIFVEQSKILTKMMEVESGGNEFDIHKYISRCTLDIIRETVLGVSGRSQVEKKSQYMDVTEILSEIIFTRGINIWMHPDIIFNRTSYATEQRKYVQLLHNFTDNVIQEKRSRLRDPPHLQNNDGTVNPKRSKKVFLDFLMELLDGGKKFTDEELRDEVNTMMFAGQDTTATVDSFIILMLANFPEVQQKCYDELCDIFGDKINDDTPITLYDMHRMEYLERVIKETLRLFPAAPIVIRKITEDINVGKHTLPKHSSAILLIGSLHRRPDIWIDPLEFNPDRFLSYEVKERHPYAYIPFSAGPRNCIGAQFAMLSMKVVIATILRKYIIRKDLKMKIKDIKYKVNIVMKPVEPIRVRIAKR